MLNIAVLHNEWVWGNYINSFGSWQGSRYMDVFKVGCQCILRDPRVASRDDALFLGESLLQEQTLAPGNLFLPNQFQKWSNFVLLIGQGNSVTFLHEVVFFILINLVAVLFNGKILLVEPSTNYNAHMHCN